MSNLLILFSNNILPIFLAAGSGYWLSRYYDLNPRPVSHLAFYVFSPCLIFNLLTANHLNTDDILRMGGFTVASILGMGAVAWAVGSLLRLERRLLVAVLLTSMFSNAGNFGLSLNSFAFGEQALAYSSLFFVFSSVLTYTVGVIIASLGSTDLTKAVRGLLKIPVVYAVILALAFNLLGWKLLLPLERTVTLLGDAAIPVLMVLLGIQLQRTEWSQHRLALSLTNLLRLVAGPVLALGLSLVFSLQGAARQAGIIEAAMPAAISTTILATEFDVEPTFVTSAVFTSTLLSPLTLTPLLAFLGA